MAVFLEGVGVIAQACTLVVGLPALFLTATGRRDGPWIVAATVAATALVMWAKAATWWTAPNDGWMAVPIAAAIVVAFMLAARAEGRVSLALAAGLVGGVIAGWMWQPCVGTELGNILNHAEDEKVSTAGRMIVYTAGALLPAVLLATITTAWPAAGRWLEHERARATGLTFGAIYAATLLSSRYDDLIGQLSRWSSA